MWKSNKNKLNKAETMKNQYILIIALLLSCSLETFAYEQEHPTGVLMAKNTNPGQQRYKYNGKAAIKRVQWKECFQVAEREQARPQVKEFEPLHGLNWNDYGARWYDPATNLFTTIDPLCEKYYHIYPYAYCGGNPVNRVDPDGRIIRPTNEDSYSLLLNTVPKKDRPYVQLTKTGVIDYALMNSHKSNSHNYNDLLEMAKSDLTINIGLVEEFQYKDNSGTLKSSTLHYAETLDEFKDVDFKSVEGNIEGATGTLGQTLLPGKGTSDRNSPDNSIYVYVYSGSELSSMGKAEYLSHELYGHAYLYDRYRNRKSSAHHGKKDTEQNQILRKKILSSRKETYNNMQK